MYGHGLESMPIQNWSFPIESAEDLTMRMHMRRFTRFTNGHSKKIDNHRHAVALHYMYYNFCKVHQTLRVIPAMEAGLSDHVWSLEELVGLSSHGEARATA